MFIDEPVIPLLGIYQRGVKDIFTKKTKTKTKTKTKPFIRILKETVYSSQILGTILNVYLQKIGQSNCDLFI